MRSVAFLNRNPSSWFGGDLVYIKATMKILQNIGYKADYIYDPNVSLKKYDLVHIVHCNFPWAYEHFLNAKKQNKKIILSTIYYPGRWIQERVDEILYGVDYIVTSTKREESMLQEIGIKEEKISVIPRGVSEFFYGRDEVCENYIFGIGRWECKKQEHVIQACKELNFPYVGVGPVENLEYMKKHIYPLKYGTIKTIPVYDMDLVKYYSGAKVVVIATDWEEFGFPLLEGGLNGCNLIATDKVGGAEWFLDITTYEYGNIAQLKSALKKEYTAERNHKNYRKYVKENFLWDKVTRSLIGVYESVLSHLVT